MEIKIETSDGRLVADLFEAASVDVLHKGHQSTLPGNAVITLQSVGKRRSLAPEVVTFLLGASSSVITNIVSSWLYEKLKGRATTLVIEKREVQIDSEEIRKVLEEIIRQDEREKS